MNTDDSSLGCCPNCGEPVPSAGLLIEYEKTDGGHSVWAECPTCLKVVTPS